MINFTCTISAVSGYAWERIDVQPNSVNSVNGKTGAVVLTESDLLTVITISSATATQALADSTIYNCGAMTSLEITLPATVPAEFVSQFNFTSGTTPTSFTSPVGMKWLGDDCNGTAFVPVASKRYMVMVASDGVSVRGIVQAA